MKSKKAIPMLPSQFRTFKFLANIKKILLYKKPSHPRELKPQIRSKRIKKLRSRKIVSSRSLRRQVRRSKVTSSRSAHKPMPL